MYKTLIDLNVSCLLKQLHLDVRFTGGSRRSIDPHFSQNILSDVYLSFLESLQSEQIFEDCFSTCTNAVCLKGQHDKM